MLIEDHLLIWSEQISKLHFKWKQQKTSSMQYIFEINVTWSKSQLCIYRGNRIVKDQNNTSIDSMQHYLPVCFSAIFNVNPSNKVGSLLPFAFTAYKTMLRILPDCNPWTVKAAFSSDVIFACSTPVCWSKTSRRKCCGWPPSKPTQHSTESESVVWLDSVQLYRDSGFPVET